MKNLIRLFNFGVKSHYKTIQKFVIKLNFIVVFIFLYITTFFRGTYTIDFLVNCIKLLWKLEQVIIK